MTAIAGGRTYDAAAYAVTLVPSGSTLHIKYAFASEEYAAIAAAKRRDPNAFLAAMVPNLTPGERGRSRR